MLFPIIVSSLCTGLGALPILLIRNISHKGKDILLAYTAGIMVAASAYGLIPSFRHRYINWYLRPDAIRKSYFTHHSRTSNEHSGVIILFLIVMSLHNYLKDYPLA